MKDNFLGKRRFELLIDTIGIVRSVSILKITDDTCYDIDTSLYETFVKWKFTPARNKDGKAINCILINEIEFKTKP